MEYTIGIDEVGRGPIAGPLVVCACAVVNGFDITSLFPKGVLKDSKKLSEKVRATIASHVEKLVQEKIVMYGLGEIEATEIDKIGLSQAIKNAVQKGLDRIPSQVIEENTKIYLDGSLHAHEKYTDQETIIKGDEKIGQIALASIIAKVYRDNLMKEIACKHPEYGFENHVGYGTKAHYEAIKEHGLTTYHRKSFLKNISV